jgi:hypothetical protein
VAAKTTKKSSRKSKASSAKPRQKKARKAKPVPAKDRHEIFSISESSPDDLIER